MGAALAEVVFDTETWTLAGRAVGFPPEEAFSDGTCPPGRIFTLALSAGDTLGCGERRSRGNSIPPMRQSLPLAYAYRLLNHGPTTLITSSANGKTNVMAAAWVMPTDFDPPRLAAVIEKKTHTRELVQLSREMVVQVPVQAQLAQVYGAGKMSGKDIDKIAQLGFRTHPASKVGAPLLEGCAAWLECKLGPEQPLAESSDLLVAEIVAAWADDSIFKNGRWTFESQAQRTLHHVAGGVFFVTGEQVAAKP